MTAEQFETIVEEQAGSFRHVIKSQLREVAKRLRLGEQLMIVAIALRLRMWSGVCVVAATDLRVILLWTSGGTRSTTTTR
jgi:hypothetical protein